MFSHLSNPRTIDQLASEMRQVKAENASLLRVNNHSPMRSWHVQTQAEQSR